MFRNSWKDRALAAEAQLKALDKSPRLIDITRNGRVNVMTFIRNGQHISIEIYAAMGDDFSELLA